MRPGVAGPCEISSFEPEYSKDAQVKCQRCVQTSAFPRTDPDEILALLGYC